MDLGQPLPPLSLSLLSNMASVLHYRHSLLLSLILFKDAVEVSNNDGDGRASKHLQLPPSAGVSGGQRQ